MKKLLTFVSLLICVGAIGQSQPPLQTIGNAGNEVRANGVLGANKGFVLRTSWDDTTAANADSYLKYIAGIKIRTGDIEWQRSVDLTRWFQTGAGSVIVDTTNTILLSGNGSSASPLTASTIVSGQQGNAIQSNGDGLFVPNTIQDGIIIPGVVTWVSGYTYEISPATYVIRGIQYTSPYTTITLDASHASLNRIDLFVVNSSGAVAKITGTPAADPQEPTIDPSTQIKLGFVLVTAASTQPTPTPSQEWIYLNNAEWTTVTSHAVRVNPSSTNNPYSVPLDVEGTTASNNDLIRFTAVTPPTISNFNVLTFKIRSKAAWASNSRIGIRWYNSVGTALGTEVALSNGAFGFNSSQTSSYQIVSIPLSSFGSLPSPTALVMTVRTTGFLSIGFYIDDIQLQGGIIPSSGYTASNGITLVGSDFQLGGTLSKNTTIANSTFNLTVSGSASGSLLTVTNTVGTAISATGAGVGTSVIGATTSAGSALSGSSTASSFYVLTLSKNVANTNSIENSIQLTRSTTGTAANGIGQQISFISETTDGTGYNTNDIQSSWSNATTASRTSLFVIKGTNSTVQQDIFTLSGSGATRLNKYGIGTFTGTPAYAIVTDASGNLIESAISGSGLVYTASNGLTMTANDVQLGSTSPSGSPFTANRYIYTSTFNLDILGTSSSSTLAVQNQNVTNGVGLDVTSDFGIGATIGTSNGTYGLLVSASPTSTNTIQGLVKINRAVAGAAAADGIGSSIDIFNQHSNGQSNVSNQIISKWTTANSATRTSQFIITGVNSAVTADLFTLSGSGSLKLNKYTTSAFTGTPVNALATDASGNVIQTTLPSSGAYTPTFTNVTNITSSVAYSLMYYRVGDVVTVSGVAEVTPTATGTINLRISLPIASALAAFTELSGSANNSNNLAGHITGDATNDAALFVWEATGTSTVQFRILFSYKVL